MNNLEDIITDSVNDAQLDSSPEPVEVETPTVEASEPEPVAEVTEEAAPEPTEEESTVVASPAAQSTEPQDEFSKLAGVPQMGVAGRENRIPYSRVKRITEKAVGDLAEVVLGRKLVQGEKPLDLVKAHIAKVPEMESKITDYEARLDNVGQFENVMANEPQKFLTMLARIPAYKEFFELVDEAYALRLKGTATPTEAAPVAVTGAGMPEPDEELSDGSKVYSMDGLKKLLEWNSKDTETRVVKQFEERYKPIEADWQERRRIEATLPLIRKQIEDAKTWPLFNENEEDITKVLAADPSISLESAYRKVVFPKIIAERNTTRQDVLKELKTAPTSTSVPARAATKPAAPASNGPRSLEDVIKESVETLKR